MSTYLDKSGWGEYHDFLGGGSAESSYSSEGQGLYFCATTPYLYVSKV
jgi:hypothetical protein